MNTISIDSTMKQTFTSLLLFFCFLALQAQNQRFDEAKFNKIHEDIEILNKAFE